MNLNEMAMEGLEEEGVDENGVVLVASLPKPTPQGDNPPTPTADEIFKGPVVPNELPTLDAEFVVFEDLQDHAADVQSIKFRLEQSKAIDKREAMAIESIVPGFAGRRTPLAGFTQLPTSTQLREARESIDERYGMCLNDLANGAKKLAAQVLKEVTDFYKGLDGSLLEIQLESTELFRNVLSSNSVFSDQLQEGFLHFLERKDAIAPELREQIRDILDVIPGNDNVRYYLQGDHNKPTVIFEGKNAVVYGEADVEIMTIDAFEEKYDVCANPRGFSIASLLHTLYGGDLVVILERLRGAVGVAVSNLDKVEAQIDSILEEGNGDCATALSMAAGDVKCRYLAVSSICSLMKKFQKLPLLFTELFNQELKEAQAKAAASTGTTNLSDKVWMGQQVPPPPLHV